MTYIINKTDGNLLTTIPDGSFDSSTTSLTLIGKSSLKFGEAYNENVVKMLENFASTTAPENPMVGQIWYDTGTGRLKVYDGSLFRTGGGPLVSSVTPPTLVEGDMWIDTANKQLWFWNGTSLTLAGPVYKDNQGLSGFSVETVLDTAQRAKTICKLFVGNVLLGIFSKERFTPGQTIDQYVGDVNVGYNASTLANSVFYATTDKAKSIVTDTGDIKLSTQMVFNDEDAVITGSLTIQNNAGLTIGLTENIQQYIDGTDFKIESLITDSNMKLVVKRATGINTSESIDAITIIPATKRVGIFNSTPQKTLDVAGDIKTSNNLYVSGKIVETNPRPIALTMDISDLGGHPTVDDFIISQLDLIAPITDFDTGTIARILCTYLLTGTPTNRVVKTFQITGGVWTFVS